jgi:3,4-dihydroxy 2-butanone 4-phosphate synthase/GTP cyclohydrolase II
LSEYHRYLSSAEDIIDEARNGRMFILIDDEDRENEGDLVIPAQMATPEAINFMAKHGRGLICLTLPKERVERLNLPLMAQQNGSRHETAFTVSIEAREGVTTGISAADRARTIQVAIDDDKGPSDIVSPGHVFPLVARDGGVLVRAGHTEAAVDVARLAGLNPSGVICEIMNDDGTMARLPDLVAFAQTHGLKIATIADLIAYRRKHDKIIRRTIDSDFRSIYGGLWRMAIYRNTNSLGEHIALVKGDPTAEGGPVMVRMHALSIFDDVLGEAQTGRIGLLNRAMQMIADHGRGVVVLIREFQGTSLTDRIKARLENQPSSGELRDYGIGAQILLDLGVREMILLTNSRKNIIGLEGYGLSVVDSKSLGAGTAAE